MSIANFAIFSRTNLLYFSKNNQAKQFFSFAKTFSTYFGVKNLRKRPFKILFATVPVTAFGAGYYFYNSNNNVTNPEFSIKNLEHTLLAAKPEVTVARTIKGTNDDFKMQLILFQYPTCPFCCKVRAFLDYYGLAYDVVEVDPVLRQQTSWTNYKKVPILLAKVDGGYQQLNDSSMIVSALKTYLLNKDQDLKEIINYYPIVEFEEKNGKAKAEILNKYFLMYQENVPKSKTTNVVMEEKKWREWADQELVHTLSPNVYRTREEALQAFKWFSEVGEWDRLFPLWERKLIVYVGAYAMWLISKNLKKRHRLKDDVRESLYDSCKNWMKQIAVKNSTFLGGDLPNLADLAVYGVLSSIEGCGAFNDLLQNTNIGNWYFPMKEAIKAHRGKEEFST